MSARFLQIHTLTNYPASLLNRDDAGFAKRMPFGGAVRTRISSQCLKRHWRVYDGENSLATVPAPESVRSRVSFERFIVEPLVKEGVATENVARLATQKIVGRLLGSEAKQEKQEAAKKEKSPAKDDRKQSAAQAQASVPPVTTPQVTVLGRPELEYLRELARRAIKTGGPDPAGIDKAIDQMTRDEKELKNNIRALMPGSLEAGLGAALFGRMVTGDILSRTDAAIHVAHAVTVHGQMTETDYFSAIDELVREQGEQESGHINASELTSGLFYGYVVVDVGLLVDNLGRDRALAGDVVERLVHIVATVSPGAKKGSTAPYAYSHLVLVECGKAQPRTLQNAFIPPVSATGDIVQNAYRALQAHLADLDAMYSSNEERAHAGLRSEEYFPQRMTLAGLAGWTRKQVLE